MNSKRNGNGPVSRWWPWSRRDTNQDLAPYRRLALQLHYDLVPPDMPRSVLLVTPTASKACGRGSTALACCLAEEVDGPVLLIDACPMDPEASRILGCEDTRGFADVLNDPTIALDTLVLPTSRGNVSVLPAGTEADIPLVAASESVDTLLKAAESRYEFVVLSGGSVLHNSIVLSLARHVGCALLLAVENETKVADLDSAQNALIACKARKLGLVLTTPVRG